MGMHNKMRVILIFSGILFSQTLFAQIFDLPTQETWRLTLIGQTGGFREIVAASIDPSGNVYVVDRGANMVHKLNRNAFIETSIGGYGWGNHEFDRPSDVWAENGIDVFVADYGNHRVQRFDRRLTYVGTLETRNIGFEVEQFGYPVGITMNRQGDLFVVDEENLRIVSFGGIDRHRRTFGGMEAGRFRISSPGKIEIYGDDLIAVRDGNRLLFFDQFGSPYREFTSRTLPRYKDFTILGEYILLLRDETIDIYRGILRHPIERISLLQYMSDPQRIQRIAVSNNRLVLMSEINVWVFLLLQ
jgi:hypothetical protein